MGGAVDPGRTPVGRQAASAFEQASNFIRSGLVKASSGEVVPLASFGAFTLSLNCIEGSGSAVQGEIDATSTQANSDGYGLRMTTAGTSYAILDTSASTTTYEENEDDAADFFTPSGDAYVAILTVGQNYLGTACYANALVSPS